MTTALPPLPAHLGPLNPEQEDAVVTVNGPLLILAGAGSGKTRVLTRRIGYMIECAKVDPERILAVTFTNKAAHEMKDRVQELIGDKGRKVWVSTFHSSCCRILRLEAEALGYTRRFAIYDDDDQLRLMRQIVLDQGQDPKVNPPSMFLSRIDHHKNRRDDVDSMLRDHRIRPTDPLARTWRAYEDALRAADAMDFNDLINKVVELWENHPDVLAKWRDKFKYVLVDEYQDTNAAQYRLLQLLTAEHRNLAVVGDDDQSIYGFRGADIRNILDFSRDFTDAKVIRLERNYRCTERILELANAVVQKNEDRMEKRLYTEDKKGGALVTLRAFDEPRDEARGVASAIRQLSDRGTPYSEMAVIYRTNATSLPFEVALRDVGVPHKVVGGRPFYSRREIRDALAYVRLVANPADDAAFLRIVNVPPRGLGTVALNKLRKVAQERGEPLLKAARALATGTDRSAKAFDAFTRTMEDLTNASHAEKLPSLVLQVLERTGYLAMLRDEDDQESQARVDNLNVLLRGAADFEPEEGVAGPLELLHAWLDRTALVGADEEIPDGGQVTLMTVHNAKGLEYPIVFVVHVVQGQFPHARSADEGTVDEERRLAYVAFTRAKDRLFITRHRRSAKFDPRNPGALGSEPVAPSPFLYGIPVTACEGDLPELEDRTREAEARSRAARTDEEHKLAAWKQHRTRTPDVATRRPAPPSDEDGEGPRPVRGWRPPEGETYRTREIESAEDLRVGVDVLHGVKGRGTIRQVQREQLFVDFGGRTAWIRIQDPGLQILLD